MIKDIAKSSNIFAAAAGKRAQAQDEIEAAAERAGHAAQPAPVLDPEKKYKNRGENSSTITMSISRDGKAKMKYFAAKRGMNASDLLHFWIMREEQEVGI